MKWFSYLCSEIHDDIYFYLLRKPVHGSKKKKKTVLIKIKHGDKIWLMARKGKDS